MIRTILGFGAAAGIIVIVPMILVIFYAKLEGYTSSLFVGYLIMMLALSLIFVGVKRYRDRALGGVIKFGPALLIGLGISVVASVIYVIGWEISLAANHYTFVDSYAHAMIAAARAKGASPAKIAKITADMAAFKTQYSNPLYRMTETFTELFPVGVLISLISAGLLRFRRFLPARPAM